MHRRHNREFTVEYKGQRKSEPFPKASPDDEFLDFLASSSDVPERQVDEDLAVMETSETELEAQPAVDTPQVRILPDLTPPSAPEVSASHERDDTPPTTESEEGSQAGGDEEVEWESAAPNVEAAPVQAPVRATDLDHTESFADTDAEASTQTEQVENTFALIEHEASDAQAAEDEENELDALAEFDELEEATSTQEEPPADLAIPLDPPKAKDTIALERQVALTLVRSAAAIRNHSSARKKPEVPKDGKMDRETARRLFKPGQRWKRLLPRHVAQRGVRS